MTPLDMPRTRPARTWTPPQDTGKPARDMPKITPGMGNSARRRARRNGWHQ